MCIENTISHGNSKVKMYGENRYDTLKDIKTWLNQPGNQSTDVKSNLSYSQTWVYM